MRLLETGLYHIYNRGNNGQRIFFSEENYWYFLDKCHRYIKPNCNVLGWSLLPNQFRFIIEVTKQSLQPIKVGGIYIPEISNGFRLLLSAYAKGINKQENRSGNLFQQKTKSFFIESQEQLKNTFTFMFKEPIELGLVGRVEDWPFISNKVERKRRSLVDIRWVKRLSVLS